MEESTKEEEKEEKTEAQKARELLNQERAMRLNQCQHAINMVLERYGCTLIALPVIDAEGRIVATVNLRALE